MDTTLLPLEWHNERRRIRDLAPFDQNPRILTEKQAADLKRSIEKFNLAEIPAINTNNMICAGHQRLKIMALLGRAEEEIDVRVPNRALTDEEFQEYCVRSNLNHGEWDFEALANNFDENKLIAWGFTGAELGKGSGPVPNARDDDIPDEVKVIAVAKPGDLFRVTTENFTLDLVCGDCRTPEIVDKAMAGRKAHITVTDPPYNVALGDESAEDAAARGRRTDGLKVANDKMTPEQFLEFARAFSKAIASALLDGAITYMFMSSQEWGTIMQCMAEAHYHWSSTIIWNKDRMVMCRKDFHTKFEPIYYGWKEGAARLCKVEDRTQVDVWDCDRPIKSEYHPTTKPVLLIEKAVRLSSKAGDMVIDFFNGSGTTGIACIKTNRNYAGIEIDPRYVDVTLRRWHDYLQSVGIGYTITRNGEPFVVPELYEDAQNAQSDRTEASKN